MLTTIFTSVELSSKVLVLNDYYEPQQAVWWFIPAIIVAVIGLFSIIIIISGDSASDTFKHERSVDLAILGPNEAGKTTLWNFFKGSTASKVYQETDGKEALSFVASSIIWNAVKLDEPIERLKFTGYDINGNGDFIRTDWEKIIEKSNMIIFVLSIKRKRTCFTGAVLDVIYFYFCFRTVHS